MSSHEVAFHDVRRRIAEFGKRAALITVTSSGTPHVVSAVVEVAEDRLRARVGPRTRVNLEERPTLSLLWIPPPGGEYHLILDCLIDEIGEPQPDGVSAISVAISGGILHRMSEIPGEGPSCIVLSG